MNVRCPSCDTLYRVDPAKVPAQGIQARCAACPAVISVIRPDDTQVETVPESSTVTAPTAEAMQPMQPAPDEELRVEPQTDVPPEPEAFDTRAPFDESESVPQEPVSGPDLAHEEPEAEEVSAIPDVPIVSYSESVLGVPEAADDESQAELPEESPESDAGDLGDLPQLPEDLPEEQQVALDASAPADDLPPVPEVPAAAEDQAAEDIEIPSPEPEPEAESRPDLEVLPKPDATPSPPSKGGARRYTRPFVRPTEEPAESTSPKRSTPPGTPLRPTAPVFRPTPGMPVQPPSTAEEPPVPQAPPEEPKETASTQPPPTPPDVRSEPRPSAPPEPVPEPEPKPRRPVNPFLSKDPKQKARRLARALVSDMIVYQPQKRQDALADGTLKDAFDEEIKKSWEEYVEQVGEDMANSTEYFKDALNDILAGGDKVF